jgi:hypothetical protein
MLADRRRKPTGRDRIEDPLHCEFRTDRSGRPALDETAGQRENVFLLAGSEWPSGRIFVLSFFLDH